MRYLACCPSYRRSPAAVGELAAPVAGVAYVTVAYDEAGNDLFVTSNRSGTNRSDIFEWHRGTANPFVQLSPPNLLPQAFAVSRDGAQGKGLFDQPCRPRAGMVVEQWKFGARHLQRSRLLFANIRAIGILGM